MTKPENLNLLPEPIDALDDKHRWMNGFFWPNDGRPPYLVKKRFDGKTGITTVHIYVFDRKWFPIIPHHLTDETAGVGFETNIPQA